MRLWASIHETLGEDLQGFMRLCEGNHKDAFARICKDSQVFGRGFARIVNLWERICKDSRAFGRGFTRIRKPLVEDLQGFVRFWGRIHRDSGDFGRGFARIFRL